VTTTEVTKIATESRSNKTFGLLSMVLFSVSAVLVGDTVASSAAMGVSGLTFWIVLGVLFFLPYGLVTAELGAAWPDEGGIYVWVREAFGPMWGTVTAWLYWVNVAFWAPSVFVLLVGTLQSVFLPSLSRNQQMWVVLGLIWVMVAVGVLPLRFSKSVPDISAALKLLVLLGVGVGGVAYAAQHGLANSFAPAQWIPDLTQSGTYLPIVIFSFMGFELMSAAGDEIKEPQRDVPRMAVLAGGAILFVYMFATFGILAAVPVSEINIVTGIADALRIVSSTLMPGRSAVFNVLVVALLFTFLGTMVTWSIGANHSVAAAAADGAMPKPFGHLNRWGSPSLATVLMGVIASALTVMNYALFARDESIFWSIFALSSVVFLLPYLLMFPSLVALRYRQPDHVRPYRLPGKMPGAWIAVTLCELGIASALVLFFVAVPEGTQPTLFRTIIGTGMAASLAIGFVMYAIVKRTRTV
jgi:glutamate:GABA antiporter